MSVVALLGFAAIVGQLVRVQHLDADRYAAFGENQRVHRVSLPAERGAIFDRNGHELALSIRQQTIWANPRLVTNPRAQAEALAPILDQDPTELQDRLSRDGAFVYVARQVDDATAARIQALPEELKAGVFSLTEPKRFTPAGGLATSVIGKVGVDNEGLSGLEAQFDERLAGRPGDMVAEQDPGGREIPGGLRELRASVPGDDLVLTLDRALQYETERALGAQIESANALGGIAIVMESSTGDILAMANLVRSQEEGGPPVPAAHNMALINAYEPGSVSKLITVAGALEDRLLRADEMLTVTNTIRVADHTFSEHDPHPTQQWSTTDIVANSSNVGSIMIGQRLGKDRLDHYVRAFGFGTKTGLGFPGESAGILQHPDKWFGTTLPTVSIGQGISVTPVQMLAAYNTVANGGTYVAPRLVKAVVDSRGNEVPAEPATRRRVVSQKTAQQLTAMLAEVVRVGTGTRAQIDGYTVAGKTGTARKPLDGARGYKQGAYVSSFAGFVPAEKPALTAIVMLDEPTPIFGGLVAAPVFADITRYGLRKMKVPPARPMKVAGVPKASPTATEPVPTEPTVPRPATTLAPGSAPTTVAARPPTTTQQPAAAAKPTPRPSTTSTTRRPRP